MGDHGVVDIFWFSTDVLALDVYIFFSISPIYAFNQALAIIAILAPEFEL